MEALERLAADVSAEQRHQVAQLAQGNIGKALQMLQDERSLKIACDARRVGQTVCIGQEFELLSCLQEYTGAKKREEFLRLMQGVRAYFMELIHLQNGVVQRVDDIPVAVQNRITTLQALQILDIIDTATSQVTQNVSLNLVAAAFCAQAKRLLP